MKIWPLLMSLGVFLLINTPIFSAENEKPNPNETFSNMTIEDTIEDLAARIEKLEGEKANAAKSWYDKIKISGDFRYRYEMYDKENASHRNRNRIRVRLYVVGEVNEWVDVTVGMASGDMNPTSTNVTLDNSFSTKDFGLDLGFADFHPYQDKEGFSLNVLAGKMKTPFAVMSKSELIWDPDLRPEGGAVKAKFKSECCTFFGNAGAFYLDERSGGADMGMFGGQAGVILPVTDGQSFTCGGGYYDFTNIKNYAFVGNGALGNEDDGTGSYAEDFDEVEAFGEYAFKVNDLPFHVFGNWVNNLAADKDDTGWVTGVKVGKVKKAMSMEFRYQYRKVERNCTVGTLNDSDFGGGGTDGKGHEFNFGLGLAKNCKLGISYFLNKINIHAKDQDYDRLQIDFKFKF